MRTTDNLITMLGWLQYDHRLARLAYGIGTVLMLFALFWAECSCGGNIGGWTGSLFSSYGFILEKT